MRAHLCQRRPSHPENPQKSCKSCFRQFPQSLVNSRHLSSNAHASAPVPTSPLPSRKSPKICKSCSDTPNQTLVISQTLTRAHLCQRRPSHPENPQKSCKSCFRQSPQSLVNSRHHSSNAHASAPVPTSPLPSRKSPKILQIQLQTIRPTLVISRVITRQTLIRAPLRQRRPSHPENPQKSCKSSFRQSPQSLVNSRHLSSNAHTSAPAPAAPLPSRKSPKILQIQLQTIPPISRKLSSSLVKRSSNTHTSAPAPASPLPSRKSPKILQILLQTIRPILKSQPIPKRSQRPCATSPLPSRKSPKIMQKLQTTRPLTAHPQYPMTSWGYYPLKLSTGVQLKTYPPPDRELLCYSLSDV